MKEWTWLIVIWVGVFIGVFVGATFFSDTKVIYIEGQNITVEVQKLVEVEKLIYVYTNDVEELDEVPDVDVVIEKTNNSETTYNPSTNKTRVCEWLHPNKRMCHYI